MKKLLSLSLAIIMLLSCVLVQTVAVSAAEAVSSTNAPYAGVYQVTSDKAVTLTNETGHTVTLAAGATDYFYLVKGANSITSTDASANVTFTALANNGMDYIAEVDIDTVPLTASSSGDFYVGANVISGEGSYTPGSTYLIMDKNAVVNFNATVANAGIYYISLQFGDQNMNKIYVETETGYYGYIQQYQYGWNYLEEGAGTTDLLMVYLHAGTNVITVRNDGTGYSTIHFASMKKSAELNNAEKFPQYVPQLNYESCKVVPYELADAPEATPAPTEEPVVTPAPETATITYTAPFAGVFEVTSDKAVTLTNETGHYATVEAGATEYFYLLKGVNTIATTDASATLTFTALEGQGIDKINEVAHGDFKIAQGHVYYASGINVPANSSVEITVELTESGMYYLSPQVNANASNKSINIIADTGLYGAPTHDRYGWCHFDIADGTVEYAYMRAGTNTVTLENNNDSDFYVSQIRFSKTSDYSVGLAWDAVKVYVEETEPEATPEPTPEATPEVPAVTVTAEGAYAGVYEVTSDKDVTITNFTGHTATLTAGVTEYFYLVKGANTIATTDETATLTFTELEDNGMEFLAEVDAGVAPLASGEAEIDAASNLLDTEGEYGTGSGYVQLGVGGAAKIKINAPETGIYYLQIQMNDGSYGDTIYMETDTGFCGTMLQYQWGWHFRTNGASDNDLTMVFLREGEGWLLLENQGPAAITIGNIALCQSAELNDAAKFPQYVEQLDMESCDVVIPVPDSFINDIVAATAEGTTITMGGRLGAEWMNELYGVEFSSNKTGTRAQKYYGARPGDIVSDGNDGTTEFTFGEWDGSFEIILEGVSAGVKEYKFFVGTNYTDAATVEVAAAE